MEVNKGEFTEAGIKVPPKIDPLWKRSLYLLLVIVGVPLSIFLLGYMGGLAWRLGKWAFHIAQ